MKRGRKKKTTPKKWFYCIRVKAYSLFFFLSSKDALLFLHTCYDFITFLHLYSRHIAHFSLRCAFNLVTSGNTFLCWLKKNPNCGSTKGTEHDLSRFDPTPTKQAQILYCFVLSQPTKKKRGSNWPKSQLVPFLPLKYVIFDPTLSRVYSI